MSGVKMDAGLAGELTTMPLTAITDNSTTGGDPFWDQVPWAHPYWHQFDIEHMPDYYHYLVGMYLTFVCPIGVITNLVVVYIFVSTKHLRTPPNMLIVNVAISDLSFAAINGFPILTVNSIYKIWKWGQPCCIAYGFIGGLSGFVSICTLAFIAFDRFYVISHPMQAAHSVTKKKTGMYILFIWTYSLIWSAPPLFGWGNYNLEGFLTSCTFDYLTQDIKNSTFNIGMFVGAFGIPVFAIFFFYIGIVKALRRHLEEMAKTAGKLGAQAGDNTKERDVEIKMAKVALTTIGFFMLSWLPYAVVTAMGMLYPHEQMMVTPLMAEVPVMMAKTSSIWNPLIYAISHPKFRAQVDKKFPWLLCCCMPGESPKQAAKKTDASRTSMSKTEVSSANATSIAMTPTDQTPAANPAGGQCV